MLFLATLCSMLGHGDSLVSGGVQLPSNGAIVFTPSVAGYQKNADRARRDGKVEDPDRDSEDVAEKQGSLALPFKLLRDWLEQPKDSSHRKSRDSEVAMALERRASHVDC